MHKGSPLRGLWSKVLNGINIALKVEAALKLQGKVEQLEQSE